MTARFYTHTQDADNAPTLRDMDPADSELFEADKRAIWAALGAAADGSEAA